MAGRFSNDLDTTILDHIFGGATYPQETTLYFALCTATVLPTDTGSTITEATYDGYARKSVTNDNTTWSAATLDGNSGKKTNAASIDFNEVTGGGDTITDVAILDAATAGNILAYGTLATSKTISTGDKLIFEVGGVVITLT